MALNPSEVCPKCGRLAVFSELSTITGGLCWDCSEYGEAFRSRRERVFVASGWSKKGKGKKMEEYPAVWGNRLLE